MLTWVEINQKAIEYNLGVFKKHIGKDVLLMPVIKSNAYGHDILLLNKICVQSKYVDRICVAGLDEAIVLLQQKCAKPIIILSFFEDDKEKLIFAAKNNVIFPIYDTSQIKMLNKIGEMANKKIKVHLKIDTGASRVGILPANAIKFAQEIISHKNLILEGVWSHFASSEDDRQFTNKQLQIFNQIIKKLEENSINIPSKHFACSAATTIYKNSHFNAVRLGLSTYGLHPNQASKKNMKLQPALSWKTKIIQIKDVPSGSKIGYGGTFTTTHDTKIAVIPVGYWDGYDRELSNVGFVLIQGHKCPVRGRICMNITMIDITAVKNPKIGDTVTLIGQDGKSTVTADDLAKFCDTINYEVVTKINPQIKRILK